MKDYKVKYQETKKTIREQNKVIKKARKLYRRPPSQQNRRKILFIKA